MSIDMYLSDSQAQGSSAWTMAESEMLAYAKIEAVLSEFEGSSGQLKGKAFDSARAYSSAVLRPLARGGRLLAEAIGTAVKRFPEAYVEQVAAESLKESELMADIAALDSQISQANQMIDTLTSGDATDTKADRLASYQNIVSNATSTRTALQEKLDKLRAFNGSSPAIFSEIAALKSLVDQGLAQLSSGWDAQQGVYILPADLSWAANLNNRQPMNPLKPMDNRTQEELDWIKVLMEQYGFDLETALLIVDVKHGIDEKFPDMSEEEKSYLLNRVLGAPVYNGFNWENTAGDLGDYFYTLHYYTTSYPGTSGYIKLPLSIKEIFQELGLSEAEANKLYYEIRKQYDFSGLDDGAVVNPTTVNYAERLKLYKENHDVSGMSEAEIEAAFQKDWADQNKRYADKTDFAHQFITTATHLNPRFPLAAIGFGRQGLEEVAGWRGDATKDAEANPSMGNDDYKADLDAVNITSRMENTGQSFLEAQNGYYRDLASGQTNRAKEFLANKDLNDVKKEVYQLVPPKLEPILGGKEYRPVQRTEEESKDYLKRERAKHEDYRDSYNFIKSLEEGDNDLGNYAEKEK